MPSRRTALRVWFAALACLSAVAAIVSWYGLLVWGYYASYVSARPPNASEMDMKSAGLRGTGGFALMIGGQIAIVGLFLIYRRQLRRAADMSPRWAQLIGGSAFLAIDVVVFAVLLIYQANS